MVTEWCCTTGTSISSENTRALARVVGRGQPDWKRRRTRCRQLSARHGARFGNKSDTSWRDRLLRYLAVRDGLRLVVSVVSRLVHAQALIAAGSTPNTTVERERGSRRVVRRGSKPQRGRHSDYPQRSKATTPTAPAAHSQHTADAHQLAGIKRLTASVRSSWRRSRQSWAARSLRCGPRQRRQPFASRQRCDAQAASTTRRSA